MGEGDQEVDIDAKTRLCLLLGDPVDHSLSPLIHNAGFKALNLNYVYLASPVDEPELGAAVAGLRALSMAGANVTSPYKKKVLPYLDSLSEEAGIIQSVNTIVNQDGLLHGTTTDGPGFLNSLQQTAPGFHSDQTIMLFGAGGAARALAYTLARNGAKEIFVVNRTPDRGEALADLLRSSTPLRNCSTLPLAAEKIIPVLPLCDLFIYSLPSDSDEIITALENSGHIFQNSRFFDLRYQQKETEVMRTFARSGAKAHNGLGMLLWQAALAFELFTGQKAPRAEMQEALDKKKIEGE